MEEQPILPPAGNPVSRPVLLTVLCILTFIGSGLNFFSSLVYFLFFDTLKPAFLEIAKGLKLQGMDLFMTARPVFFAFTAAIYLLAAAGAVLMWQLRKPGFHVYTVAQILLIIAPMYFFRLPGPSVLDILLSGAFVLLYGSNLKKMS
jgi:hypothetical protein